MTPTPSVQLPLPLPGAFAALPLPMPTIDPAKKTISTPHTKRPPRRPIVGLTTVVCDAYDCLWNRTGACSNRKIILHATGPRCTSYEEDPTDQINSFNLDLAQRMYATYSKS